MTRKPMRIGVVLLVAFYMPLWCWCAVSQAAVGGDAAAGGAQQMESHCGGGQPACHSSEDADAERGESSSMPCGAGDSSECECDGTAGHMRPGDAVTLPAKPATLPDLDWSPLPAVMLPASMVDQPQPRWAAGPADERPRLQCAPTLFALSCLLTI